MRISKNDLITFGTACILMFYCSTLNRLYCINELWHEISNNVVCATSEGSDQPELMRSLIRAFASRLNIL